MLAPTERPAPPEENPGTCVVQLLQQVVGRESSSDFVDLPRTYRRMADHAGSIRT